MGKVLLLLFILDPATDAPNTQKVQAMMSIEFDNQAACRYAVSVLPRALMGGSFDVRYACVPKGIAELTPQPKDAPAVPGKKPTVGQPVRA